MIRVMLVDRSPIFAEALAARLDREVDISVLAAHVPVEVGRRLLASGAVDVAVCDDQLAGDLLADAGSGNAIGTVARRPPHVVVLAEQGNEDRATALVQAGIAGWVTRDQSSDVLLAAIRGANDGETWIPPALLTRVLADLTSAYQQERAVVDRLTVLTEREREILSLLGNGLGRAEVAAQLHLSQHTVRTHVQNIRSRLAVHSTLAAVAVARAGRADGAVTG